MYFMKIGVPWCAPMIGGTTLCETIQRVMAYTTHG
jgi:hypothetical protein